MILPAPDGVKSMGRYHFFGPDQGWAIFQSDEDQLWRLRDSKWDLIHKIYSIRLYEHPIRYPLFAPDPDHVWIINDTDIPYKDELILFNGKNWISVPAPNSEGIRDIWFTSPSLGWAACEWGQMMQYDGQEWNLVSCPVFNHIEYLLMLSDEEGWAMTDNPVEYLNYSDGRWQAYGDSCNVLYPNIFMMSRYLAINQYSEFIKIFKHVMPETELEHIRTDTLEFGYNIFRTPILWIHPDRPTIGKFAVFTVPDINSKEELIFILKLNEWIDEGGYKSQEYWILNQDGIKRKILLKALITPQQTKKSEQFTCFEQTTILAHGICISDLSGDGIDDIYTVITGRPNIYRVIPDKGELNEKAGLIDPTRTEDGRVNFDEGASSADIDNDGDQDLFVTSLYGPNLLFKQIRKNYFREDSKTLNLHHRCGRSNSGIWGDVNNDGWIDLYVSNDDSTNRLYLNNGAGFFKDVTREAGLYTIRGGGGSCFGDIDDDGDLDIFVPRRGLRNLLFINETEKKNKLPRFIESARDLGIAGEDTLTHSTSGVFTDIDNDGDLDLFVTNLVFHNWLYRNDGQGHFEYISESSGLTDQRLSHTSVFWDADDDGDQDLFVGNRGESIYYENKGNSRFDTRNDLLSRSIWGHVSGLASVDYDRDGDLDIQVSMDNDNSIMIINNQNNPSSIHLRLHGTISNRDAIGARVYLYESGYSGNQDYLLAMSEVNGGSGFNSMNSRVQHFGVPDGLPKDLIVRFPSGIVRTVQNLRPGRMYTIYEQEGRDRSIAYFKKGVMRIVRSPVIQREMIYVFCFISIVLGIQILFRKKSWWQRRMLLFSAVIPILMFFILYFSLDETVFFFSHIFPFVFGLLICTAGLIFGQKVAARSLIRFEYYEKLFFATNNFFHGEWGAKKLNRMHLYCANMGGGKMLTEEMKNNFTDAAKEYYELVVPEVERITLLARAARLKHEWHARPKEHLMSLSRSINQLNVDMRISDKIERQKVEQTMDRIRLLREDLKAIRNKIGGQFATDVYEIIQSVVKENRQYPVALKLGIEKGITGRIRPSELHQIVNDLIINAAHATESIPNSNISLNIHANLDFVFIEVENQGEGVPEDIEKKLFNTQVTTKHGAGGYGLFHARQILEKYGDAISYKRDKARKRTIFQIQLRRIDHA
jgi:signal transduction histidine kinase